MTGVGGSPRDLGGYIRGTDKTLVSLERRLKRSGALLMDNLTTGDGLLFTGQGTRDNPLTIQVAGRLSSYGQQVTDWNDAQESGNYWSSGDALNNPVGNIAVGHVLSMGPDGSYSRVMQEVWFPTTSTENLVQTWRRVGVRAGSSAEGVGTWGDWILVTSGSGSGAAWADITGKPSTFPPSAHTHAAADVTSGTFAPARLPAATETAMGAVERATLMEVWLGTDPARVLSVERMVQAFTEYGVTTGRAGNAASTTDWNAATATGFYFSSGIDANTPPGSPNIFAGIVTRMGSVLPDHSGGDSLGCIQEVWEFSVGSGAVGSKWSRGQSAGGSWTEWASDVPAWADITGKPSTFPSTWATVSGKPSTFLPPQATTSAVGGAELATNAEAIDGVDATRIVTPAALAAALASSPAQIPARLTWSYLATDDLDTIVESGWYIQTSSNNSTLARNYPSTRAGFLEVVGNAGAAGVGILQRYTDYFNNGDQWERVRYNGVWEAWVQRHASDDYPVYRISSVAATAAPSSFRVGKTISEPGTGMPVGYGVVETNFININRASQVVYEKDGGGDMWWRSAANDAWTAWRQVNSWADISGKPSTFLSSWGSVSGKPTQFPPESHTHNAGDIASGLFDPLRLPIATTTERGAVERATQTEVNAGTDTLRYAAVANLRAATWLPRRTQTGTVSGGNSGYTTVTLSGFGATPKVIASNGSQSAVGISRVVNTSSTSFQVGVWSPESAQISFSGVDWIAMEM